jgi:hypothetical protein
MDYADHLSAWADFYRYELDTGIELPSRVPPQVVGFDRLLVVSDRLSHAQAIRAMSERFGLSSKYEGRQLDVDQQVRSDRSGNYAVWVRDEVDADTAMAHLSARDAAAQSITSITLLERLLFGLRRFIETGRHLDISTTTLCAGSRNADGSVPLVQWQPAFARVRVHWGPASLRSGEMRLRQVIA